jgi:superfamily II DNA or RNA helicase
MKKRQPAFAVGEIVQRINQPEAVGLMREARWDSQLESWNYLVQFGVHNRAVPEDAIQRLVVIQTPWDALRGGQLSGIEHFIFTLTFHRLQNPPARIAHSFASTRTLFYPHQFKPLLKFLDNPGKRLLIADDVGLGKTIEAGYILRELEAHEPIERVLIVVPARLAPKWKREMHSRFQETFEIVKGSDLIRQAERIRQGREPEAFRWITSYESIRPEEVRLAIEQTELPIDVLIADEAHRMRNPDTLQHRVGAALCNSSADTVVFLSATPVQNRLEDLWHLVRLLSPEEFAQWEIFQEQMASNRFLLSAQRALASNPADFDASHEALQSFIRSRSGTLASSGQFTQSVLERMETEPSERREIVELQADIGRLSPIGHIICRTRKAEALTKRPKRYANWKRVRLTTQEQEIYDSVEDFCRATWPGVSESWGFQMSLLMAYRMTASCMPAAMSYFAEKLSATATIWSDEIEESEDFDPSKITAWSGPTRDAFSNLVLLYQQGEREDTKLNELLACLKGLWKEDDKKERRRRKVVIFSFFRRTLEYLSKQLAERKILNRMIHGGISVNDREIAIDDFLESQSANILLTSEVGGEGLDLQKASVVINYDLPWNPMVVEQRIGRIDRIGQDAERIIILNLIIEGSVEERVLERLLNKIDIFRGSIGEMDDIIGDEVERITAQALRGELSDRELERVIEERGDAMARRVHEAQNLLSRVDGLLAADQGLIDEINSVVGERQIPAEPELFQFLNRVIGRRFNGCQLPESVLKKVVEVDIRQVASGLEENAHALGTDALLFARRIGIGSMPVTLSREAAYTHSRAELIHLHHPLTRYAVAEAERSGQHRQAAFAIRLKSSRLPEGEYAFLLSSVHIKSHRPTTRLVGVIASRSGEKTWNDSDETIPIIVEMLERGRDHEAPRLGEEEIDRLQDTLMSSLRQLTADWEARERRLDQARREQQYTSRMATLEFLATRAKERLDGLMSKGAAEFAIRMGLARYEKAQKELTSFLGSPPASVWGGIEYEEIAVGLLRIEKEGAHA